MTMDLEIPQIGVQLPVNFPNGWVMDDHKPKTELKKNSGSMLELTTSRVQQDVR